MPPFAPLPLSALSRPSRTAEAYHPAFARLLHTCPSRTHALQAARLALLPPPEPEEQIARNGHDLFLKLMPTLPATHRERGTLLEEAFRPLLLLATDALETMPALCATMPPEAAERIVRAYVSIHWARGAQTAAMALYSSLT